MVSAGKPVCRIEQQETMRKNNDRQGGAQTEARSTTRKPSQSRKDKRHDIGEGTEGTISTHRGSQCDIAPIHRVDRECCPRDLQDARRLGGLRGWHSEWGLGKRLMISGCSICHR